jgi:hypothetical protein
LPSSNAHVRNAERAMPDVVLVVDHQRTPLASATTWGSPARLRGSASGGGSAPPGPAERRARELPLGFSGICSSQITVSPTRLGLLGRVAERHFSAQLARGRRRRGQQQQEPGEEVERRRAHRMRGLHSQRRGAGEPGQRENASGLARNLALERLGIALTVPELCHP